MQSLAVRADGWTPSIVKTVASEGRGIAELAAAISDYETHLKTANLAQKRTIHNWQQRLIEMIRDAMLDRARGQLTSQQLEAYAAEIAAHRRDPYSLVEEIVTTAALPAASKNTASSKNNR
jgi:LAO/AO transport system kinase